MEDGATGRGLYSQPFHVLLAMIGIPEHQDIPLGILERQNLK